MSAAASQQPTPVDGSNPVTCIACGKPLGSPERLGAAVLASCACCGSQTALPRPSLAAAASLHDSDEYFAKEYFETRRRRKAAKRRFGRVLALLERVYPEVSLSGRRLLDIGCDTGEFAAAAAELVGMVPYGVDVAERPLVAARAAGLEVAHGDVSQAPEGFSDFALVTAIDVIEHVPDPVAFLVEVRKRLASGGVIYVETPNWASFVYTVGRLGARAGRGRPSGMMERLFPSEHIQYFTPRGMSEAAARAGMRPVALFTQALRYEALAVSRVVAASLWLLQLPDRLLDRRILLSALLEPVRGEA